MYVKTLQLNDELVLHAWDANGQPVAITLKSANVSRLVIDAPAAVRIVTPPHARLRAAPTPTKSS